MPYTRWGYNSSYWLAKSQEEHQTAKHFRSSYQRHAVLDWQYPEAAQTFHWTVVLLLWWTTDWSLWPTCWKILNFLVMLNDKGFKYSTLNTALVTAVNNKSLCLHPLVSRFTKRIFKNNPPLLKYQTAWDILIMLNYLSRLPDISGLHLKPLTLKELMLIALGSVQRSQTLHMLDISFMKVTEKSYKFALPDHVRKSWQGYKMPSVVLKAYLMTKLCEFYIIWKSTLKEQRNSETVKPSCL